jgi:release factor glutamine methyltransferase
LKNASNEAPANDAGVLLCYALKCDRSFMYAHGSEELTGSVLSIYKEMLEKRTCGVPLQYIAGIQEFMSLEFEVGPGVLIPRHDTEVLVETIIKLYRENDAGSAEILDIGTGSGCIAVSLAYYLPECKITALDKMSDALATAEKNANLNGVRDNITFIKSDLFEGLTGKSFNFIVSNPPYIRSGDIAGLQREVRFYEPLEALDGGNDGLNFYRTIIEKAPEFLKSGGFLAFETGYDQAAYVSGLMTENFIQIKICRDLSGIDRVVVGRKK